MIGWTPPTGGAGANYWNRTGIGQQQKFIRKAIAELVQRLERDFNRICSRAPPGRPSTLPARTMRWLAGVHPKRLWHQSA